MPGKDSRAERASIRELLTARPRGGRVNLAATDPSETHGIERHVADERTLATPNERRLWTDYQKAYAAAIGRCSTNAAPWYVIPADRKWYRNRAVSQVLIETMEEMKLIYPKPQLDIRALKKSLKAAA